MAPALADEFATPFARATGGAAMRVLHEAWGIEAQWAERVDTERDDSFRVRTARGDYILKIAHPDDDPSVVDFTTVVVDHALSRDTRLPVPAWVPAASGSRQPLVAVGGVARIARLARWMPGTALRESFVSGAAGSVARDLGRVQGRLTAALADFDHAAADRALVWDVARLGELRPLLDAVSDKAPVSTVLDEFEALAPHVATLPRQVIHNDANLDNVLVRGEAVSALLDFGDAVRTARAIDLAVSLSYLAPRDADDPDPSADLVAGFEESVPLTDLEHALLPALVRARLAQRILLNSWLARERPENADYHARTNEITTRQLVTAMRSRTYVED